MADNGEQLAYKVALGRGELSVREPFGANFSGADFITATIDQDGKATIIITDAKTSSKGRFPEPKGYIPPKWEDEARDAVNNIADDHLKKLLDDALEQNRVEPRQIDVDFSPQGQGAITIREVDGDISLPPPWRNQPQSAVSTPSPPTPHDLAPPKVEDVEPPFLKTTYDYYQNKHPAILEGIPPPPHRSSDSDVWDDIGDFFEGIGEGIVDFFEKVGKSWAKMGEFVYKGGKWLYEAVGGDAGETTFFTPIPSGDQSDRDELSVWRSAIVQGGELKFGSYTADDFPGGPEADVLTGGAGPDRVAGEDGDDRILGDGLWGDPGNDDLSGGAGNDTLGGGGGRDIVKGEDDDDELFGEEDADDLYGGSGNDKLAGGFGTDALRGDAGNDSLWGEADADHLYGGDNDDHLFGGFGRDQVFGNGGDDTLWGGETEPFYFDPYPIDWKAYFDEPGDRLDGGEGNDKVYGSSRNDQIAGGVGDDVISGDGVSQGLGKDQLYGGPGRDTLSGDDGNDTLDGGADPDVQFGGGDDDTFYVRGTDATSDVFDGGEGYDRVVIRLPDPWTLVEPEFNSRELYLSSLRGPQVYLHRFQPTSIEEFDAAGNAILGTPSGDYLDFQGIVLNNTSGVSTGEGDDQVVLSEKTEGLAYAGGTGIDTLRIPGLRSVVELEEQRARMVEAPASGTPTVRVVSVLAFENVIGTAGGDTLSGDAGDNRIEGGSGNDTLTGRRGDDVLIGDADSDTVSYTEAAVLDPNVDSLWIDLSEEAALLWQHGDRDFVIGIEHVVGSDGRDVILGSDEANHLEGGGGTDMLLGGTGPDTLDGGDGADYLLGGEGDDAFIVEHVGDVVVEEPNAGSDTVRMATASYVLPDNVENLELLGDAWLHGIANDLDNVLVGNDAPNALFGRDGNDTILGGGESDGVFGGNGNDSLHGDGGPDKVYGGEGNDRLDGGEGNDILTGKLGSDVFIFNGSHGVDSVRDFDAIADHLEVAGGFWAIEMADGTLDGVLDHRDANVFYGIPQKNDVYQPHYEGPPDGADAEGMNIIAGAGIIHLDGVFVLAPDDVWNLA